MSQFGKTPGETFSLEEFSTSFRRRNLDVRFTREDQRLIFELYDPEHEDSLPVDALLAWGESGGSEEGMPAECRLEEIKSRFSEAVERHRVEKKLPLNQAQAEKQVINSLSADESGRTALDPRGLRAAVRDRLGLQLSEDDVGFLLERAKQTYGERLSVRHLVRFLRPTDMDLDVFTVSDARSSTITLLRRRLKAIREFRDSDSVAGRLADLQDALGETSFSSAEGKGVDSADSDVSHQSPSGTIAWSRDLEALRRPGGKRLIPLPPHDWSRVGVGTGSVDPKSALAIAPEEQFVSRNAAVYTPFRLEQATNTLYRPVRGDAEREAERRRLTRESRHRRTTRNLEYSKAFREKEDLLRALVQLRRNERKTESQLQYETRMFLEDMKLRKKQPLTRMSKRSNETMARAMWGGSMSSLLNNVTNSS